MATKCESLMLVLHEIPAPAGQDAIPRVPLLRLCADPCGGAARLEGSSPETSGSSSAAGSAPRVRTFEELDRNKDGFIEISESAALPGLAATFERADSNRDGRLDKVEFARALAFIDTDR